MPGHDIVVVGASAGGVEALSTLVSGLPRDLPAAVLIVLHLPPNGTSALPAILERRCCLEVVQARHGDTIEPGRVSIAPVDHHLLVRAGRLHLARGPRENGVRPAVDPLFRSAARYYTSRVIAVVMSGSRNDGTSGLAVVKQFGGVALVQDPAEALTPGMPESAIAAVEVDEVLSAAALAGAIDRISREPAPAFQRAMPPELVVEDEMGELAIDVLHHDDRPGTPSGFSCPDCGGVLWELRDADLLRFRCRVGHAWSSESLLGQQTDTLESALWVALRSLEERSALSRRMSENAGRRGHKVTARRFGEQAADADRAATSIRNFLLSRGTTVVIAEGGLGRPEHN
jgi:two-component system chemotaxis response regulator CheB